MNISMAQELKPDQTSVRSSWKASTLSAVLAGDVSAAAISATLVSPVITAIDRAVVENAASSKHPLLSTLKSHILYSLRHPRAFYGSKPFFLVWTLYAATYTTANAVETLAKTFIDKKDELLIGSLTFLSTCIVNVPLGVWKDVRYVQMFGRPTNPAAAAGIPLNAGTTTTKPSPQKQTVAPRPPKPTAFPGLVGATFLFRDAITIAGSVTLPPIISHHIPSTYFSDPALKMATLQLLTPILSQVVATPVHLLGLDLYGSPEKQGSKERMRKIRRNLGPTTLMRCSRIIPAFGAGMVCNTGLRGWFHGKVGIIDEW